MGSQVKTYHEYALVPLHLRRQWCRMHIQKFPHVPKARRLWQHRTKAVLCLLVEDDKVLAWCMYIRLRSGLEMYTYTRKELRGRGLGKRVAEAAKLKADMRWPRRGNAKFFPHDDKASALYQSLGWHTPPPAWQRKRLRAVMT